MARSVCSLRAPFAQGLTVFVQPDQSTPQSVFIAKFGLMMLCAFVCMQATAADKPRQTRAPQPSDEVKRCLAAAAEKYGLDYQLLKAIARVESGFNPRAVRLPHAAGGDSTTDYGLMQINSTWLPKLKSWGLDKNDLFDPCVSAEVGAWVLKSNFRDMGVNWNAVGAYNARSPEKRKVYAWRVYRALVQIQKGGQNEGKGLAVAEQHSDTVATASSAWGTPAQEVQPQAPSRPSFIEIQQARHEGEGQ